MQKPKRKITLVINFEKDKLPKTEDIRELEYRLISTLKEALNEDRLIIKEIDIKSPLEIEFETIII